MEESDHAERSDTNNAAMRSSGFHPGTSLGCPAVGYTQTHIAILMSLSPWQSWGNVFCRNTGGSACTAVLECGQMNGGRVTWDVTVKLENHLRVLSGQDCRRW